MLRIPEEWFNTVTTVVFVPAGSFVLKDKKEVSVIDLESLLELFV